MRNPNQTAIKYLLYCRKSSEAEDRQLLSIESQTNELKKLAKNLNLNILEVLTESQSAKGPGRPVFNQVLFKIQNNEAQGILCWKLDRLARNPVDGGQIMWMLQKGIIKHIKTFERDYFPTDNVLMMAVELGMANQFLLDLSTNTKRGLRAKAEKGWIPGVPPPGYMRNKFKEKGEKDIIKDPERFPLVRKMWDLILTGNYTPPQILKKANEEWNYKTLQRKKLGGNPLSRSTIYKIFTNPFYSGWFNYQGKLWKGAHKAMITEEEFDKVQILLGIKEKPRMRKHDFLYTGAIHCGQCGAMVTAEEKIKRQKNGNIHQYTYFHCTKRKDTTCKQESITIKELEKQFDEHLSRIEIDEDYKNFAIKHLNEVHDQEAKSKSSVLNYQQKTYKDCLRKIDNLVKLKISPANTDGTLLSDEEFKTQKSKLLKEKTHLEEMLNETGQRTERWLELSEKTFNFACYARYWFANGAPEQKKQIFRALGSNLFLKDKKLTIDLKEPFRIIEESKRFEPLNFSLNERKTADLTAVNPTWLRR